MTIYYTYILRCADDSFYVGSTADLHKRLDRHNQGHGSSHTRKHRPVELIYYEQHPTCVEATQRERQIKKWTRIKKKALADGTIHHLKRQPKK